jgi:hypothetical protein
VLADHRRSCQDGEEENASYGGPEKATSWPRIVVEDRFLDRIVVDDHDRHRLVGLAVRLAAFIHFPTLRCHDLIERLIREGTIRDVADR